MADPTNLRSFTASSSISPRPEPIRVPKLYAIADVSVLGLERLPEAVEIMAGAGVEWIQLRAKGISGDAFYRLLEQTLERVTDPEVRLWVDDRVDIAALFSVAGVHVGQEDLLSAATRRVVGARMLIGCSTHDDVQVALAAADPEVDVVALGPIFETRSKQQPDPVVGLAGLRRARRLTTKPLVAIGGIHAQNLASVLACGVDSAVVLGAICHGDVERNSRLLLARAKEIS